MNVYSAMDESNTSQAMSASPSRTVDKARYVLVSGEFIREPQRDKIAVEEPLQLHLYWPVSDLKPHDNNQNNHQILTITMRTPDQDKALAIGLLRAEGIIQAINDVQFVDTEPGSLNEGNQLHLLLNKLPQNRLEALSRNFISHSSCGICGKTSLKALELNQPTSQFPPTHPINPALLTELPEKLRQNQQLFSQTGGIHAAGIFDIDGNLSSIAEDVGRHNALDKAIGLELCKGNNSQDKIIVVSGRASFELVQKAIMGGYAVMLAVGAPSSLAITAAERFDLTLIGFLKKNSFNLYSGEWRLMPVTP